MQRAMPSKLSRNTHALAVRWGSRRMPQYSLVRRLLDVILFQVHAGPAVVQVQARELLPWADRRWWCADCRLRSLL